MSTSFLQKTAFLVPFCIGLVVIGFVLWYARVRHPLKRLRPPFGMLLLLGIVFTMIDAAIASFVARAILTSDELHERLTAEEKKGYDYRGSSSTDDKGTEGEEKPMTSWERLKYGDPKEEAQDAGEPVEE